MNRYDHTFSAICPSDGATIIYHLRLKTEATVLAEDIIATCQFTAPKYHEALADELLAKLGGRQRITAMHQGVFITTTRALRQAQTEEGK